MALRIKSSNSFGVRSDLRDDEVVIAGADGDVIPEPGGNDNFVAVINDKIIEDGRHGLKMRLAFQRANAEHFGDLVRRVEIGGIDAAYFHRDGDPQPKGGGADSV